MSKTDTPPKPPRTSRGPERLSPANLRDVAAHAQVSLATASRVFSGNPKVRAESRERVLASAAELGYVVNGLARAMTGRGPRALAFVVRDMIGPSFAALAAGVESVAQQNGELVLISTTEGDQTREKELIGILREQRARAVLLVGSTESDASFDERVAGYARDLAQVNAPLILCGRPPIANHPELISVDYDQHSGVGLAVDELIRLGHRRIGYIGAQPGMTTADLRLGGYQAALRRHGIAADPSLIRIAAKTEADGAHAVDDLLAAHTDVTAIVAMTDVIAIGAYRSARAHGLSLPEELSIVGFDDIPLVGDLTPALSTVHPPFFELGTRAAEIALGLAPAENVLLSPHFVRRESTVPPKA